MRSTLGAIALFALTLPALADEPTLKVGVTIFADATVQTSPEIKDADGNTINMSAFNVSRAYLNVTGSLNKRISFRITPDVAREAGSGSSLAGSQNFRLKYAFAQLALDEWTTKGSWLRFGTQQTPYLDYSEAIYRYRFQGTSFAEREGYITSSDNGLSARYVLPGDYGDVHAGFYNGDGYSKAEVNDQKSFQLRASVRPLPKSPLFKGLRATLFYDGDSYVQSAKRERVIAQASFEHKFVSAGVETIATKDRTSVSKPELDGNGWSAWATPKFGHGWELLLRHDDNRPDDNTNTHRRRDIAGVAYWLPELQKVATAVMVDYDSLSVTGKARDTRYGLKLLVSF